MAAVLGVGGFLATAALAASSVDCDSPDDFCTGDPCVTTDQLDITVASCVLDFGPRVLIIDEVVRVPNNGVLSLTAGAVEVRKRIDGKHIAAAAGDGADVSLIASGNVTIRRRVDVTARNTPGSILIDAGGSVELRDQLRAAVKGNGAVATGGSISVQADGTLTSTSSAKVDARGKKKVTAGGQITLAGQSGVNLKGKVDARGNPGGSVAIGSSAGNVLLQRRVRGEGQLGAGGTVSITASGNVTTQDQIVTTGTSGGTITIAVAGTLSAYKLRAKGLGLPGGTVAATAGTLDVKRIETRGRGGGGAIAVTSTAGNVTLERLDARSLGNTGTGGTITVESAADLICSRDFTTKGEVGGTMRFTSAGNMILGIAAGSDFDVRGAPGGSIDGEATGDLTARGDFTAESGGCIGLSAGGTLDVSAADFDVPPVGVCVPACSGQSVGGFCWFLGAGGDSCDTTCAAVGQTCDPATTTYAGSGGSDANCTAVLSALGATGPLLPGPTCAAGTGCESIGANVATLRCANLPTTCAATGTSVEQRACACQ